MRALMKIDFCPFRQISGDIIQKVKGLLMKKEVYSLFLPVLHPEVIPNVYRFHFTD
jgi:hypothetical protein